METRFAKDLFGDPATPRSHWNGGEGALRRPGSSVLMVDAIFADELREIISVLQPDEVGDAEQFGVSTRNREEARFPNVGRVVGLMLMSKDVLQRGIVRGQSTLFCRGLIAIA